MRNKVKTSSFNTSIQHNPGISRRRNRQERETERMHLGKEEVKPSLPEDDGLSPVNATKMPPITQNE